MKVRWSGLLKSVSFLDHSTNVQSNVVVEEVLWVGVRQVGISPGMCIDGIGLGVRLDGISVGVRWDSIGLGMRTRWYWCGSETRWYQSGNEATDSHLPQSLQC